MAQRPLRPFTTGVDIKLALSAAFSTQFNTRGLEVNFTPAWVATLRDAWPRRGGIPHGFERSCRPVTVHKHRRSTVIRLFFEASLWRQVVGHVRWLLARRATNLEKEVDEEDIFLEKGGVS